MLLVCQSSFERLIPSSDRDEVALSFVTPSAFRSYQQLQLMRWRREAQTQIMQVMHWLYSSSSLHRTPAQVVKASFQTRSCRWTASNSP